MELTEAEDIKEKWSESRSVVSNSLWPHGLYSPRNFPGQNTGVGSLSLLQAIVPAQESNPGLLHCRWLLYQLSHKGSPEDIKERWQEYTEKLYKKDLHNPDNHNGVITHTHSHSPRARHPGMWSQWALESITTHKASGGDGIPGELFQILKDDAVKVLHSICQQIWKTQQWPQDWKRAVFIPIPKKANKK